MLELPVRPATTQPVSQLMLYVTEQCNLRCSYCFVDKQPRHLSLDKALRAVDFFLQPEVSGQAEALHLNFFGGEPFLRPEVMLEVVRYARRKAGNRIRFGATTNGTLANPRVQQVIEEGQLTLLLSLDGDEHSHLFRPTVGGRNSYHQVEKNLRSLLQWSPESMIRMTYHPGSLKLLDNVQAAMQLGAPWISLSPVIEADWTGVQQQLEQQSQRLTDWFLQEIESGRVPPLEMHWRFLSALQQRGQRPARACELGKGILAVDTAGNILPCHRYLYRKQDHLGSLDRPERFSERRQPYLELTRAEVPECATCIANTVCGGGCRVVAQEAGYGLQGVHPNHCLLTRIHVRQMLRVLQRLGDSPRLAALLQRYMRCETVRAWSLT